MTQSMNLSVWLKLLFPAVLATFLFTACTKDDDNGGEEDLLVEFADSELEEIVRESLNIGANTPLTESVLANLTSLNINNSLVSNISGLEKATNLESFFARSTEIVDMAPLANLSSLKEIDMRDAVLPGTNPLSFLANLNNIERIDFQNIPAVVDISVLSGKNSLTHINLRETGVRDIAPLTGMTQLQFLNLNRAGNGDGIINPELIAPMVNLYYLSLRNTNLGDEKFQMFENFTKLVETNLRNTGITDITPLVTIFQAGAFTQTLSDQFGNKISLDLQNNSITNLCDIKPWVDNFPEGELETAGNFDFNTCP